MIFERKSWGKPFMLDVERRRAAQNDRFAGMICGEAATAEEMVEAAIKQLRRWDVTISNVPRGTWRDASGNGFTAVGEYGKWDWVGETPYEGQTLYPSEDVPRQWLDPAEVQDSFRKRGVMFSLFGGRAAQRRA